MGNRLWQYVAIVLLSCGIGACHTASEPPGSVFCYNQVDGIETLDPAFAKSLAIMWGVNFLYNTLVEVDSGLQLTPSLARSWDVSADGLRYTFQLRTDVYFHDNPVFPGGKGRKFRASDVVYSFRRLIDPATASSGAWIFNGRLNETQPFLAPNDSTFILQLRQPFRPLLEILSMPYCSIVPEEAVVHWGKDFRSHPCGTGPFQLAYWDENNLLMLHRNPHYWEHDRNGVQLPYLSGVKVLFNQTRAMEFLLFKQKKIDFMNGIDGAMQDLVLTKRGALRPEFTNTVNLTKRVYLNTEYLGFLLDTAAAAYENNPLALKLVRQAISYAIDKQKIVTYFRNGVGVPATGGFIPAGMPGVADRSGTGYRYDPKRARALLAKAGFPGGKGMPEIVLSAPDAQVDICNFVVSQLQAVGIPARVEVMQKNFLRQQMSSGRLAFFKAQWIADYPDAETYLAFFYSQFPAPPNYTRFRNATFDRWYQQSLKVRNDRIRFALYGRMDSLISAEAAVVPLYYDEMLHFTQKNISGLQANALNMIDLRRVRKK